MNSLEELNNSGANTVTYTDNRPTGVIFDKAVALDVEFFTVTSDEIVVYPTINIKEIINPSLANVRFRLNLSDANATVDWPAVQGASYTTSQNGSIHTLSGIETVADWNNIKNPTINLFSLYGSFSYTASIIYDTDTQQDVEVSWNAGSFRPFANIDSTATMSTSANFNWDLNLNLRSEFIVGNILELAFFSAGTQQEYTAGSTLAFSNPLQVVNFGGNITVTVTPTLSALFSDVNDGLTTSGTGGTASYDSNTKTLTITGTRSQVNSHLSTLEMRASGKFDSTLTYVGETDDLPNDTYTSTFPFTCVDIKYLALPDTNILFDEDNEFTPALGLIKDNANDGTGTYTVVMSGNVSSQFLWTGTTSNGSGGTATFDFANQTFTFTGTRDEVNSHLETVTIQPKPDLESNFTLNINVTTPDTNTNSHNFTITRDGRHDEMSNLLTSRSFFGGQGNLIFSSSTPQIIDEDETLANRQYRLTIDCFSGSGKFQSPLSGVATNNYVFEGTKDEVNNEIASIKFVPLSGQTTSTDATLRLYKDGAPYSTFTQVAFKYFYLNYQGEGTLQESFVTLDVGSGTWTPPYEYVEKGGKMEILLVGGGGAGNYLASYDFGGNGSGTFPSTSGVGNGGGNGGIEVLYNQSLSNTAYTYQVGAGGKIRGDFVDPNYPNTPVQNPVSQYYSSANFTYFPVDGNYTSFNGYRVTGGSYPNTSATSTYPYGRGGYGGSMYYTTASDGTYGHLNSSQQQIQTHGTGGTPDIFTNSVGGGAGRRAYDDTYWNNGINGGLTVNAGTLGLGTIFEQYVTNVFSGTLGGGGNGNMSNSSATVNNGTNYGEGGDGGYWAGGSATFNRPGDGGDGVIIIRLRAS